MEEPMTKVVTTEELLAAKKLLARREWTQKELNSAPREFGNGMIDRDEYSRRVNDYIDAENQLEAWRNHAQQRQRRRALGQRDSGLARAKRI